MFYQNGTFDNGLSDHQLVYTSRKHVKMPKNGCRIKCRNYKKFKEADFQREVDNTDWSEILNTRDPNKATDLFQTVFGNICNKHAPLREINFRQHAPALMSGDYLAHVDEKKFLCKQFNRNPSMHNLTLKMEAIPRTNALHLSLQQSYFQETLRNCRGNMKEMWRTIKKFWPYLNKSTTAPKTNTKDELNDIANTFNDFFVNVGLSLAAQIPEAEDNNHAPNILRHHRPPVFEFLEPSLEEIVTIIHELSATNACSLDGITLRLIKTAGRVSPIYAV